MAFRTLPAMFEWQSEFGRLPIGDIPDVESSMKAFLAALYVSISFLSPMAFPPAITALHMNAIAFALAAAACLPAVMASGFSRLPDWRFLIGLLFSCTLSLVFAGWMGAIPVFMETFIPVVSAFIVIAIACTSGRDIGMLVTMLTACAFFIIFRGYVSYAAQDMASPYLLSQVVSETETLIRFRGLGVLSDPNDLAQFLLTLLPLQWLRWMDGRKLRNFFLVLLPAGILIWGIFLTHSRGGLVALVFTMLFWGRKWLGPIGAIGLAGAAVGAAIMLNVGGGRGMTNDDGGRIDAWATGLIALKSHPLLGIGPNNFNDYNESGMTAHNTYVLALSEIGIVGYAMWIAMPILAWVGIERVMKAARERLANGPGSTEEATMLEIMVRHGVAIQVSLVGMLSAAFFISRTYALVFYVLLAMAAGLRLWAGREGVLGPTEVGSGVGSARITKAVIATIVLLFLVVRLG